MRPSTVILLALVMASVLTAQVPDSSLPPLPKDPRAMLDAAASLYNFNNDSAQKPFHLKGSYQLFDEDGKLSEQGTYEYWWIAPNTFRNSWTRSSAMRSEWQFADGRRVTVSSGDRLLFVERDISDLLFAPLPDVTKLDSELEVNRDQVEIGKQKYPCAMVSKKKYAHVESLLPGTGQDMYCFDPASPLLRLERFSQAVYVEFSSLHIMGKRVLAHGITMVVGRQTLLKFKVDSVTEFAKDDSSMSPPGDASQSLAVSKPQSATERTLLKKDPPRYPEAAKEQRITGVVLLDTLIGTDGMVKDVRVLSTPSPLLTKASVDCIKGWQYKPYILDGRPQEVGTMISVLFQMSP